ncbi:GntR family transcriptional regulator [Halosquirtibacter xylanolyticus]|nr:GntR family transcriptional regulator [Prolixibacteraceae bacterium]
MKILKGEWLEEDKIPSIRSLSLELELNPNTIKKAINELILRKIIYKSNNGGFSVSYDALKIITEKIKYDFFTSKLPDIFECLYLCEIPFDEVEKRYQIFKMKKENQRMII